MKIEDAINELKDSIKGGGYQCHKEVYETAIRSLELWKELEPDTDYDDGEFWAYSKSQIEDSIAEIEGGRP